MHTQASQLITGKQWNGHDNQFDDLTDKTLKLDLTETSGISFFKNAKKNYDYGS